MISDKTARALEILERYHAGGTVARAAMPARWFGEEMWKDSPAMEKHYHGHGTTKAKGLWLSAGSYLRKLEKRGLVEHSIVPGAGYSLTEQGKAELAEYRRAKEAQG